jgi:hypothetical protein
VEHVKTCDVLPAGGLAYSVEQCSADEAKEFAQDVLDGFTKNKQLMFWFSWASGDGVDFGKV